MKLKYLTGYIGVLILVTVFCSFLAGFMEKNKEERSDIKEVSTKIENKVTGKECSSCGGSLVCRCLGDHSYSYTYFCSESKGCVIDVYKSSAAEVCTMCKKWEFFYPEHVCMVKHSVCGEEKNTSCSIS